MTKPAPPLATRGADAVSELRSFATLLLLSAFLAVAGGVFELVTAFEAGFVTFLGSLGVAAALVGWAIVLRGMAAIVEQIAGRP